MMLQSIRAISLYTLLLFFNTVKCFSNTPNSDRVSFGWNACAWKSICVLLCRKFDSNALILQTSAIIVFFLNNFLCCVVVYFGLFQTCNISKFLYLYPNTMINLVVFILFLMFFFLLLNLFVVLTKKFFL